MSTDLPIQPNGSETPSYRNGSRTPAIHDPTMAPVPYGDPADWGTGGGSPSRGSVITRYLSVANRFKWVALIIIAIGVATGYMFSRLATPTYQVQARLWFDESAGGKGPITEGQLIGGKDNSPWLDLLTSYAVLDYVVISQRLFLEMDPADAAVFANFQLKDRFRPGDYQFSVSGGKFRLETAAGALVEAVAPGDSLGRSIGFSWVPSPRAVPATNHIARFTVKRPRDRARELGSKLVTKLPKMGTFALIELTDTDPGRAARTLNAVIDRFTGLAAELKDARLKEFATTMDDQLALAQANLQSAEIALASFRVSTATQPSELPSASAGQQGSAPAMSNYVSLKVQHEQLERDRTAVTRALERATAGDLSTAELEVIGAAQGSSELKAALSDLATKRNELRTLQYRYTDEYSGIKRLRAEMTQLERETIPALLRGLLVELGRREEQIGAMLSAGSSELRSIPPRVMEEARLSRQVSIADRIYTSLRQRHEEARLAALGSAPDVRVVDRAVAPQKPLKDRRTFMIVYGLGGSLALVVVGILLLDKLDRRVRFPEEVTHGLRLPILAAIPRLKGTNGNGRRGADTSHVIEAFRGLRMTMLQERGTQGCLISAITSPGSGDGKSFVAVNLAFALADQGYRTLLIDGDIRRGGLHHLLGRTRKPGLTDYLAGNAAIGQIVQSTSYPLLDLVASGRRLQTGPELLGSQKLPDFLREMRSQYAVVLIDTPPLGAGVDPFVLGMAAGSLVLVLRTGLSDMEFTEAKLTVLDRLPVRIIGAILNGVPPAGAYKYYGYIAGYESADEEIAEEPARLPVLS